MSTTQTQLPSSLIARDVEQAAQHVESELAPYLPDGARLEIRYQQLVSTARGGFSTERTLWSVTAYGGDVVVKVHRNAHGESSNLLLAARDATNAARFNAGLEPMGE